MNFLKIDDNQLVDLDEFYAFDIAIQHSPTDGSATYCVRCFRTKDKEIYSIYPKNKTEAGAKELLMTVHHGILCRDNRTAIKKFLENLEQIDSYKQKAPDGLAPEPKYTLKV